MGLLGIWLFLNAVRLCTAQTLQSLLQGTLQKRHMNSHPAHVGLPYRVLGTLQNTSLFRMRTTLSHIPDKAFVVGRKLVKLCLE